MVILQTRICFINIKKVQPTEIYNLAAQSHVVVSFEVPEYTANADALAVKNIRVTKFHGLQKKQNFIKQGPRKCLVRLNHHHR